DDAIAGLQHNIVGEREVVDRSVDENNRAAAYYGVMVDGKMLSGSVHSVADLQELAVGSAILVTSYVWPKYIIANQDVRGDLAPAAVVGTEEIEALGNMVDGVVDEGNITYCHP